MANSSKHFASITSFISHTVNLKEIRFPEQQITLYCKQNNCTFDKIQNIYNSFYDKFKWSYDNFNEIIILLCIALKKIDLKINKENNQQVTQSMLKKSLGFVEDLITSKMILVCLASKNKHNSILQHFIYAKSFLNLLIPQILVFEFHSQLIGLLQNCNKSSKAKNFIGINFLIESILISTAIDFLSEESEKKFKNIVMNILQNKKKVIMNVLWNSDKSLQRKIEFNQIAYLRLDIESQRINYLQINNEGQITVNEKNSYQPQQWINEAYKKTPNISIWKSIKINNVIDIYQFLFKLQVFASSPQIEQLDSLIPNNDQFMDLFSKFLMGQNLIQTEQKNKNSNSSNVIKNIFDIKKLYDGADKTYKNVLKKQLSKIFSQNNSQEEQSISTSENQND